jgi:hypothetical protein
VPSLPPLEGFRWHVINLFNQSIEGGKTVTVFDEREEGYLVFVYFKTDSPELAIQVDLEADGTVEINLSPKFLYEIGMTTPNTGAAYVTRYDTTNNVYVTFYTPSPWYPFKGRAVARIVNPTSSRINYDFVAWLYVRTKHP